MITLHIFNIVEVILQKSWNKNTNMQFFKTFKIGQLIKKFNKTCDTVEARPVIIPDKIMNNYDSWKEYQYLTSNEIKNVLNESINFYLNKFNELVIEILSFNFFDDFLTFYEYYSQAREKKGILLNNNAQRIRFIRKIVGL